MSVNGNISAGGDIRGTVSGPAPIRGSTGGMKVLHTDSYAIAVANGFVGTVDEWLESLKGPKGDTGISPVVAVEDIDGGHRVTITDKDGEKTFDVMDGEDGAVTEEQIASAVEDYMAEHPVEVTDIVKTVNGISPDENGNVEIPVSGGNVDLTGYATEQYVKDYAQPKGNYLTAIPDGYAKTEDIPTKPEDIGAQPAGNYALKTDIPSVPVRSVNGKIGAVSLSASDVGARPSNWMPTAQEVGALPDTYVPPNQTAAQVGADPAGTAAAAVSAHNTSTDSHWDLRLELKVINDRLTAFFDSDNQTLDELSEIVAYITSNKALIDSITTSKVSVADIINNLTTNVANKPLSAAQGVALKGLIDSVSNSLRNYQPKGDYALRSELPTVPTKVSQLENDTGYLTKHQDISGKLDADKLPEAVNTALAQAKASGEFDGQPGQPGRDGVDGKDGYTPVKGKDYYTEADTAEFSAYIASELAKRGQLAPEYANNIEECTDTSKMYVLPDGFIYAWMLTEKEVPGGPAYTNLLPLAKATDRTTIYNGKGYKENTKLSGSGGGESTAGSGKEAMCSSGFIFPVAAGDILRIKGVVPVTGSNHYIVGYDSSNARTGNDAFWFANNSDDSLYWIAEGSSGKYTLENNTKTDPSETTIVYTINTAKLGANVNTVRICMGMTENTIVTLNEEIKEGGGTTIVEEWAWANTGLAFVPADYEDRIIDLETKTAQNTADISALKKGSTTATPIKTWDAPIYDANIPVFQLSAEKAAIADAEKTVAGVYAKYDALMARHPNYITKTDLGMCSDGVTPVYRYDFREPEPHRGITGKKEWSETKSKAIIVSGIHWEWGGIFALYNALEELADNPALFNLRRNTHLIVLPVCNPYAVANMSVRNANQVEIHRNFEVDFIYPGEAGYIELGERSHGGTEPLSEVETQYIDNIMKANTDAAFFLTCHSNQSDTVYGTGFTWASPATYYMCNMHYRLVDKLSDVWMKKYGNELAAGMADYRTENTPEWDNRLGSAYLSTTNGTETKQATKYGIQATNIEVTDAFLVHGTKVNPEPALSSFTMSRGAEVYLNFLLTAFGVYDPKDKKEYIPTTV